MVCLGYLFVVVGWFVFIAYVLLCYCIVVFLFLVFMLLHELLGLWFGGLVLFGVGVLGFLMSLGFVFCLVFDLSLCGCFVLVVLFAVCILGFSF